MRRFSGLKRDSAMKVAPRLLPAMLASLATLSAAGCRTASTGSIAHKRPPEIRPLAAFDLQEFVAEHNENAERIQSLEAKPAITVTMGPQGDAKSGAVDGLLAVERPRNFKLELAHSWSTIGDIGSNDERFWFWFKNSKDRSVYYCDYSELDSTSLAVTYQPDWIVDAMGLTAITPDDAAQIKIRRGIQPGTTILTFAPTRTGGQTYSRVMVVSDSTRKVSEFRIISSDGKATIAQATIKKYRDLPLGGRTPIENSTAARATCSLPENIVLEWKRELLSLDVVVKDVKVNQFDTSKRMARFVQPTISGYAPVNLAEVARQKDPASSTAVRQTIPVPETPNRGRLNPTPLQIRGADANANTQRRQNQVVPKSPVLLPVLDLEVLDAPVPTAPGTPIDRGRSTALLSSPGNSLER
jgi:hypothetical protein